MTIKVTPAALLFDMDGTLTDARQPITNDVIETLDKVKSRPNPELEVLGVLITLHDKRTTMSRDVSTKIHEAFGSKVFKTRISKSIRLEESPAYKESIFSFAPHSSGAFEYYSLSEEVMARV